MDNTRYTIILPPPPSLPVVPQGGQILYYLPVPQQQQQPPQAHIAIAPCPPNAIPIVSAAPPKKVKETKPICSCLICGESAVLYDAGGKIIPRNKESSSSNLLPPQASYRSVFITLCKCLQITKKCIEERKKEWMTFDSLNPFPFCESCEKLIVQMVVHQWRADKLLKPLRDLMFHSEDKFIKRDLYNTHDRRYFNFRRNVLGTKFQGTKKGRMMAELRCKALPVQLTNVVIPSPQQQPAVPMHPVNLQPITTTLPSATPPPRHPAPVVVEQPKVVVPPQRLILPRPPPQSTITILRKVAIANNNAPTGYSVKGQESANDSSSSAKKRNNDPNLLAADSEEEEEDPLKMEDNEMENDFHADDDNTSMITEDDDPLGDDKPPPPTRQGSSSSSWHPSILRKRKTTIVSTSHRHQKPAANEPPTKTENSDEDATDSASEHGEDDDNDPDDPDFKYSPPASNTEMDETFEPEMEDKSVNYVKKRRIDSTSSSAGVRQQEQFVRIAYSGNSKAGGVGNSLVIDSTTGNITFEVGFGPTNKASLHFEKLDGDGGFLCTSCLKILPQGLHRAHQNQLFRKHFMTTHPVSRNKFQCLQCRDVFGSKLELIAHCNKKHFRPSQRTRISTDPSSGNVTFQTGKSRRRITLTFQKLNDDDRDDGEGGFKCTSCGLVVAAAAAAGMLPEQQKILFRKHFLKEHRRTGTYIQCNMCLQKFLDRPEISEHFSTSHNIKYPRAWKHYRQRKFEELGCGGSGGGQVVVTPGESAGCTVCGRPFADLDSEEIHFHQRSHWSDQDLVLWNIKKPRYKLNLITDPVTGNVTYQTGFGNMFGIQRYTLEFEKLEGDADDAGGGEYKCSSCQMLVPRTKVQYKQGSVFRKHFMDVHRLSGRYFQCTLCQKVDLNQADLFHHLATIHGVMADGDIKSKYYRMRSEGDAAGCGDLLPGESGCDICGKLFTDLTSEAFHSHVRSHWSEQDEQEFTKSEESVVAPYKKQHTSSQALQRILSKVKLRRLLQKRTRRSCPQCGKFIAGAVVHMEQHVLTHLPEGERPVFLCSTCGAAYRTKQGLDGHTNRVHANNDDDAARPKEIKDTRRLLCSLCGQRFAQKISLDRHLEKHESGSLNAIQCKFPSCGRTFETKDALKEHISQEHGNSESAAKRVLCFECGLSVASNWSLKMHIKWHSGEKNFKCDLCSKTFPLRDTLLIHMAVCHHQGEKYGVFKCGVEGCDVTFSCAKYRGFHMRTKHKILMRKWKGGGGGGRDTTGSEGREGCRTGGGNNN